jgi:hypothetical protein
MVLPGFDLIILLGLVSFDLGLSLFDLDLVWFDLGLVWFDLGLVCFNLGLVPGFGPIYLRGVGQTDRYRFACW